MACLPLMRRVPVALSALVVLLLDATPVRALTVQVDCGPDCSDIPIWLLVPLIVIGVVGGYLVFLVPYWISRRVTANPLKRAAVVVGGMVGIIVAIVVVARALVLVLPD